MTLAGMTCLCPLAMFFDFPQGLLLLWGIILIFGGIFWFGFRFKKLTGQGMRDEAPWFLRGGLATMLQLTGYVIQEPVIFGPPFSVFVLGGLLCLSPIFIPNLRPTLRRLPFAAMPALAKPAPPNPAPKSPAIPEKTADAEPAKQVTAAAPATVPTVAKDLPTLSELFAKRETVYLTELAEFDVQAGPCPIGKHGNLGNGNRIAVQGKASPHGLGMHPPNPPLIAKASFRVEGQRATLRGGVALNDTADTPWGAAIFAIHADGKLLWRSPPIKSRGSVTDFELDIENVDVLELSVLTEGLAHYVHAVWVEPRLIKKFDETNDE